jgi:hypothetical protein
VIPLDLATRLSSMARLRNLLVVVYGRVDDHPNDAPAGVALAAAQGELVFCRDPQARLAFLERTALRAMNTRYLRWQAVRHPLGIPPR